VLRDIFLCWVLTPLGAAFFGYLFFKSLNRVFYKWIPEAYSGKILRALIILSGCYVAYTWGANDVANATGLLNGSHIFDSRISLLIGGSAIILGILTWGYRVIETIGTRITHLGPLMAFCAQLASAVNVHIYTLLGIPVSTSHSIVGSIFGVGLVMGARVIDLRILREIVVCWIATPLLCGAFSYVFVILMILMKWI
ncbi:anion permease, partial [bacterium]|nr:anion permease [bacterium]